MACGSLYRYAFRARDIGPRLLTLLPLSPGSTHGLVNMMIVVFDGVCNFCNHWVSFVIRRDRGRLFRFAAAQTTPGRQLMNAAGMPADLLDTLVLFDGDRHYTRSEAVLRILSRLAGWRWATAILSLLPRALRDRGYEAFARRRYRPFGKSAACWIPDASVRDRFLS